MKTIFTALNGAFTITESGGVFSINLSEALSTGQFAGLVKGTGSIQLDAGVALKAGEALLNSHLPTSAQALATVVEGIANQAIAALE